MPALANPAAAAMRGHAKAGLLAFLLLIAAPWPVGAGELPAWVASGAAGAHAIELLECRDGRVLRTLELRAPLAAAPALAPDASALYLVTRDRRLQRYALPGLVPEAGVVLDFEPLAIAAGGGPDAIVLVGGRGTSPLSAHAPDTLAVLQRYAQRDGLPATVEVLLDNPGRQGFAVGFSDLAEVWEIVYDRNAAPVLLGLVHDYRNNEAVPLPGRLTARPFRVASPTGAFVLGPVPWELARIDTSGRLGVLSLELRREIERPVLPGPVDAQRLAAWRVPAAPLPGSDDLPRERIARGWMAASPGSAAIVAMRAVGWQPLAGPSAAAQVLALAPAPDGSGKVLVAHGSPDSGATVSLLDSASGTLATLASLPSLARPAASSSASQTAGLRFVAASGGPCTALLDAEDRWLAGFEAMRGADAPSIRVRERSRPGSPAETSSAPPRR